MMTFLAKKQLKTVMLALIVMAALLKVVAEFHGQRVVKDWAASKQSLGILVVKNNKLKFELQTMLMHLQVYSPNHKTKHIKL